MKRKPLRRFGKRADERRTRLQAVRSEVLSRARWACERCGDKRRLILHHRLSRAQGGLEEPENLAALCTPCHSGIHDHTAEDWQDWIVTRKGGTPNE